MLTMVSMDSAGIVFFTVVLTTSSSLNNFFLLQSYLRIKVQVSEKSLEKYLEDCMEKGGLSNFLL